MNPISHKCCPASRTKFALGIAGWLFGCGALPAQSRHLFLDPGFVQHGEGVSLSVNPPQSREIVIRPDRPWEQFMITFYLTVLDEGGKLRMWYVCRDQDNVANVAYAESADGVHWIKPSLGLVDYHGSKDNNLVGLAFLEGNVFKDPHATDPNRRYVYVTTVFRGGGIYRFTSPDGLRWQRDEAPLLPFEADSQNVTFWDEPLKKYVLFFRGWSPNDPRGHQRKLVRMETDRLDVPLKMKPLGLGRNSDAARSPFIVDEAPTVLACDEKDPDDTDVYTNAIQRYPLSPDWYVGFPSLYRHTAKTGNDGRTEGQFISSTDGISWNRYNRQAYTQPGLVGSESGNMVYMGVGLVIRGDEIWQFGTGFRTTHGDVEGRKQKTDGAIFRYVQRFDGFVSLDFSSAGGSGWTAPVAVDGSALFLNLDTGAMGNLRVGLCDQTGREIPGFGVDDCDVLKVNSTRAVVTWHGHQDTSALRGQKVQVAFRGARTKLYSLRFE